MADDGGSAIFERIFRSVASYRGGETTVAASPRLRRNPTELQHVLREKRRVRCWPGISVD